MNTEKSCSPTGETRHTQRQLTSGKSPDYLKETSGFVEAIKNVEKSARKLIEDENELVEKYLMEVEIIEKTIKKVLIEVDEETSENICKLALSFKSTSKDFEDALHLVKNSKTIDEEIISHECDLGMIDFLNES